MIPTHDCSKLLPPLNLINLPKIVLPSMPTVDVVAVLWEVVGQLVEDLVDSPLIVQLASALFCGKPNHTVETCWENHSKPEWATQLPNHAVSDDGTDIMAPVDPKPTPSSGDSATGLRDDINQLLRRLHTFEASSNTSNGASTSAATLAHTGYSQDLHTRKMIGGGHEKDGLYYVYSGCPPTAAAIAVGDVTPFQWHCRLGHLSLSRLQLFFSSFKSVPRFECEACELGKHHRVSFPSRFVSRSPSLFSLVHSDVWDLAESVTGLVSAILSHLWMIILALHGCTCYRKDLDFYVCFTNFIMK
ncbi:uncharacterized protein LOC122063069 [Macadamia integrifolia]|uniref:uncharacterized protein LOC122063069 n=1 Tax=Macadamia integrifolia TaxID=60698 RepID=UPI001C4F4481|nr:uncharacterized protein LOC122063069 [Macadamia integrifolia]